MNACRISVPSPSSSASLAHDSAGASPACRRLAGTGVPGLYESRLPTRLVSGLLLAGVLVGGCSSNPPSFGEKLRSQGDDIAEIGESWEDGRARVRAGRELIAEGREQVEDGKADIAEGERMVRTGKQTVKDSERKYREVSGGRNIADDQN